MENYKYIYTFVYHVEANTGIYTYKTNKKNLQEAKETLSKKMGVPKDELSFLGFYDSTSDEE